MITHVMYVHRVGHDQASLSHTHVQMIAAHVHMCMRVCVHACVIDTYLFPESVDLPPHEGVVMRVCICGDEGSPPINPTPQC